MKLLLVLVCFIPAVCSADCQKEETGSLWVERYECDNGKKITKGYELFNDSIVVEEKGKTEQIYLHQNDKLNPDYVKAQSQID